MAQRSLSQQITVWLTEWRQGDERARDRLFDAVHPHLRQIASRFLHHERRDHTLEPNALVNELCAAVRPAAVELVDAFGIPGGAVEVPMVVPSQHE